MSAVRAYVSTYLTKKTIGQFEYCPEKEQQPSEFTAAGMAENINSLLSICFVFPSHRVYVKEDQNGTCYEQAVERGSEEARSRIEVNKQEALELLLDADPLGVEYVTNPSSIAW